MWSQFSQIKILIYLPYCSDPAVFFSSLKCKLYERSGSFFFPYLFFLVENCSSLIITAFLTWQNCLILPAVSPWIQMCAIYSRQWRRALLKILDKAEHTVNTHSCGQRNECLSPVCQVLLPVSPPVLPALSFSGLSLRLHTMLRVERDFIF